MWKTRTKISKILTNVHAGFVTALLGCVLTFAPLNAMAVSVSSMYCTQVAAANCSTLTAITPSGITPCDYSDMEYICLQSTMNSTQKVRIRACSCGASATEQKIQNNSICGTITLNIPKCTSGSDTDCTPTPIIPMPGQTYTPVNTVQNCLETMYQRVNGSVYASCTSCLGSTSMQTKSIPVSGCADYEFSTCPCTQSYQCPTPNPSTTTFAGIRQTFVKSCNTVTGACGRSLSTCSCAKNYYGTVSKSGQTCSGTCTKCATDPKTGVAGVTASYGNGTASERCYIPSGEAFTDEKGSGTYSGACYDL